MRLNTSLWIVKYLVFQIFIFFDARKRCGHRTPSIRLRPVSRNSHNIRWYVEYYLDKMFGFKLRKKNKTRLQTG